MVDMYEMKTTWSTLQERDFGTVTEYFMFLKIAK